MGIGQSIKKGFSITKSSLDLVVVLFVFGLVWNLINLAISARIPAEGNPDPATTTVMVVTAVLFVLATIFFQAGSLGYVKEKLKTGAAKLSAFTASGSRYYVSILAVAAVVTLIIGVFVLLAALSASALPENLQVLAVILSLVFAALGLTFVVLLFLAPYIVVAEDSKAAAAMRKSVELVKKNAGVLLGLSFLLILIGFGTGLVLGAIFAGISLILKGVAGQVVFAVLSSIVNAYLGVVVTGSFMNFYLSLPQASNPVNNN
jgi:hypothetical protein